MKSSLAGRTALKRAPPTMKAVTVISSRMTASRMPLLRAGDAPPQPKRLRAASECSTSSAAFKRSNSVISVSRGTQLEQVNRRLSEAHAQNESLHTEIASWKTKCEQLEGLLGQKNQTIERMAEEKTILEKQFLKQLSKMEQNLQRLHAEEKTELEKQYLKQLNEMEQDIRRLHEECVSLKGNIRVSIRIRPIAIGERQCDIKVLNGQKLEITHGGRTISGEFQHAWSEKTSQAIVFESISDLIKSALHGYNVAIIAYGQTGSGKTYTIEGGDTEEASGILPRALHMLFKAQKELAEEKWKIAFKVAHFEVYNENLYDLLSENVRQRLQLHLINNQVELRGLQWIELHSVDQICTILERSKKHRSTSSTKYSIESSRSHAIFQITIDAHNYFLDRKCSSVLSFVDLAGSERVSETLANDERLTEANHINNALLQLRNVMRALLQKAPHVPYRNSKLTMSLSSSLGLNSSKTLMIVTIRPNLDAALESIRSLEFASHVNSTNIGTAKKQLK